MFAAAKKGNKFLEAAFIARRIRSRKREIKNFFQKRHKKYCGNKKRVLYLHPLNEETSWEKRKEVHGHIELTA